MTMAETKKTTTKKKSTAITKKEAAAIAQYDYDQDDLGYDQDSANDILIPRLKLMQPNSPELDTIDGAKPGMILNTVTQELMDEVIINVAKTEKKYVEWTPKDKGGGFVGDYAINDPCLLYTSPSPRDLSTSRMPSSA